MVSHVANVERAFRAAREAVGIVQLSLRSAATIARKTSRPRARNRRDAQLRRTNAGATREHCPKKPQEKPTGFE